MIIAAAVSQNGTIAHCLEEACRLDLYDDKGLCMEPMSSVPVTYGSDTAETLTVLGVGLFLCGSMDHFAERAVRDRKIAFIRDTEGPASDVISAWRAGYICPDDTPMCINMDNTVRIERRENGRKGN